MNEICIDGTPYGVGVENIKVVPGGILEETDVGGNVDPQTGEMYPQDRVCPLDIALGYAGQDEFKESNVELLEILLEKKVDVMRITKLSNYDLNIISQVLKKIEINTNKRILDIALPINNDKKNQKIKI